MKFIVRCNGAPCTDFDHNPILFKTRRAAEDFIREIRSPNYILVVDIYED